MINQLSLLKLNSNASSKEKITHILSEYWPLTSKQKFEKLKRNYSQEISYQAVHKMINELTEENILEKNNTQYSLSKKWITSNKQYFENIDKLYSKQTTNTQITANFEGTTFWNFDDYSQMCE